MGDDPDGTSEAEERGFVDIVRDILFEPTPTAAPKEPDDPPSPPSANKSDDEDKSNDEAAPADKSDDEDSDDEDKSDDEAARADKSGYVDVTSDYASQLTTQCTEHVVFDGITAHSDDFSEKFPWITNDAFVERIVCAEKAVPIEAKMAFSPLMGTHYFPPWISGSSNKFKMSCGGHQLNLTPWAAKQQSGIGALKGSGLAQFGTLTSSTCCPPLWKGATESMLFDKADGPYKGPWDQPASQGGGLIVTTRNTSPWARDWTEPAVRWRADWNACYRSLFGTSDKCESGDLCR